MSYSLRTNMSITSKSLRNLLCRTEKQKTTEAREENLKNPERSQKISLQAAVAKATKTVKREKWQNNRITHIN